MSMYQTITSNWHSYICTLDKWKSFQVKEECHDNLYSLVGIPKNKHLLEIKAFV